ncbi:hypothetical protein, variant 2 [Aphanomyces astaci]|uniref:Uncharacterized protein n=1 Tax=Aphanomyces astaci TaxID=112090 RepID=W4FVK2_APHAT|nr:hypothetical protein, variant 2 [Aphanomyces astaci]ETV70839.1 hypothetical protein, variant 2 [Aphanomyces astaci]|eukprot:XP_009839501.1 hypothetical protein, variant 2 [Aphanomyces astaci]
MKLSKSSSHSSRASTGRKSTKISKSPPQTPPDECDPVCHDQHYGVPQYHQPPQRGYASNPPGVQMPPPSSSLPTAGGVFHHNNNMPSMMEPADVLHRLETKESRMHQLSALLETMKHESAGTAEAMERTLHENDTLQRMNQQLTHDLQAAIDATEQHKTDHAKQIQEVMTVFTDERRDLEKKFELYMESRQAEFEAARVAHDDQIAKLSQDTMALQEKNRELSHQCESWQDQYGTASDNLSALMRDQEATKGQHKAAMEALAATLQDVDTEKQELGKLLADAFHDLERCRAALLEANNNVTQLKTSLTQNDQSWTNTLTSLESQILESHAQQQLVKDALRVAEAALQVERSQKEELNAAMRTELQRYTDELDDVQAKHATSLAVVVAERNECQDRLSQVKERAKATDKQLQALRLQFEDAMEGAKLTLAAKTADADKQRVVADRNLAEMNSQCIALAQDLAACQAARTDSEGKFAHLQQGCVKLSALVGIDSSSSMDELVGKVDSIVATANDRLTLLQACQARESQLSMDSQAFAVEHAHLQQSLQSCTDELESVKQDCAALVVEMQSLTAAHDKALMEMQSSSQRKVDDALAQQQALAVSTMQLQRSVDGQRARIDQLEDEKRELLQEADALNKSLETSYQVKNALQMDMDATKHRVVVLQSEHNDLQDAHDQLTAAMATNRTDWSAKLAESDALYQRDRHEWDKQSRSLLATVATLEGQVTSLNELVVQAREDSDACRRHAADLAESLERTRVELIDAQDSCAEWKDKADGLATTSSSVESTLRADLTASSGQCLALAGDKRRLESTAASLETLNGQLNAELHTLRQEKQCLNKHLEGRDDELLAVQGDLAQVKAELERVARSKQTLQTELSRAAEDLNDSLRQLEVLRREFRSQEKAHAAAEEGCRKDMDMLRTDHMEAMALNEELQAKISTIQSAANATINDLVAELTHAEDLLKADQARRAQDDELLRSQCRSCRLTPNIWSFGQIRQIYR